MFRRRSTDASAVIEADLSATDHTEADSTANRPRPGLTAPKGVPTPKRSEAQANRRQPYQAPADRKAAARQARERSRAARIRNTEAYQRGEESALPKKDKGPVRALARDVVDARRGIGEYFMILVIAGLALLLVLPQAEKTIADAVVFVIFIFVIIEGQYVSRKIKRLAAERHPGHSTQGVTMYAMARGVSMRRLRMPKPRVNRGDQV